MFPIGTRQSKDKGGGVAYRVCLWKLGVERERGGRWEIWRERREGEMGGREREEGEMGREEGEMERERGGRERKRDRGGRERERERREGDTRTHSHSLTLTHTLTHSHTHSHPLTHSLTHSHPLTLTHSLTLTHTHSPCEERGGWHQTWSQKKTNRAAKEESGKIDKEKFLLCVVS